MGTSPKRFLNKLSRLLRKENITTNAVAATIAKAGRDAGLSFALVLPVMNMTSRTRSMEKTWLAYRII